MTPSVAIPAGALAGQATIESGSTAGQARIDASFSGSYTGSALVDVAPRTASIVVAQTLIGVGRATAAQLTLARPAPAGGVTVTLTSDNPTVATVAPSSVEFLEGETSKALTITGTGTGLASITGTATGFNVTGGNVNVTSAVLLLGPIPTLGLGQSAGLQLSLSEPAASDVVVVLASSDENVATVTSPVTIAAGSSSSAVAPQVTGTGLGTATISAVETGTGYASDTETVTVALTATLGQDNISVRAARTQNLAVQLSAPAPVGGYSVTLASNDTAIATVEPASLVIAEGQTSAQAIVTGVAEGVTVVRLSVGGTEVDQATVTVGSCCAHRGLRDRTRLQQLEPAVEDRQGSAAGLHGSAGGGAARGGHTVGDQRRWRPAAGVDRRGTRWSCRGATRRGDRCGCAQLLGAGTRSAAGRDYDVGRGLCRHDGDGER